MELIAFHTPEHEPFLWRGEDRAALLVHGFPGTPAEMRKVGEVLHGDGWTVQGLLLPGFGREFADLPQRRHADWAQAIDHALAALEQEHRSVLLVGNSMGAALSLHVAAQRRPSGMVLFAPFWRVNAWLDAAYPLARRLLPEIKPFRRANFSDPTLRSNLHQFIPDVDLDDPAVQATVRELSLPVHVLGQVRRSGRLGYRSAARVTAPVLIVQGAQDVLVKPRATRRLARRLPNLAGILEVDGTHESIVRGGDPSWPAVAAAVRRFAAGVSEATSKRSKS